MKKILFPLLLLASFALHAQTVNITLSKDIITTEMRKRNFEIPPQHIGSFFYHCDMISNAQLAYTATLFKAKQSITLHKYDSTVKEVGKHTIGAGLEYGPFVGHLVAFNQALLLVYYQVQGDNIKLLMTIIDPETLAEKETKELYSIAAKNTRFFSVWGSAERNKLITTLSPDGNKLLVCQSGNTNEIFTCIINKNFGVEKTSVTTIEKTNGEFAINNGVIDDNGNIYCSYTHTVKKEKECGIFALAANGKKAFADFTDDKNAWKSDVIDFHTRAGDPTLYVYANYYGEYLNEGLLVSSFNIANLSFGKTNYYPYPDDMRKRLSKMDFGAKNKSVYTVWKVDYKCTDMEDGTIAFTGTPMRRYYLNSGGYRVYMGPIINFFVRNDGYNVGAVYRSLEAGDDAGIIAIPYKSNLVLLYKDGLKNVLLKDTSDYVSVVFGKVVSAKVVISGTGALLDKQPLDEKNNNLNYLCTTYYYKIAANKFMMPTSRDGNLLWAAISIE